MHPRASAKMGCRLGLRFILEHTMGYTVTGVAAGQGQTILGHCVPPVKFSLEDSLIQILARKRPMALSFFVGGLLVKS